MTARTSSAGVGEWTSTGPDGSVVQALALHPSNPSTIYLATIRHLYKSTDAGVTWALTGFPAGAPAFLLPTSSPDVVYGASNFIALNFFRSTDGGETWVSRHGPPIFSSIRSVAVDPEDVRIVYAATEDGIFRTTDGGDTWNSRPNPVVAGAVAAIAVDPRNPMVLYAAIRSSSPVGGVWRSADRGATWSQTNLRELVSDLVVDPAGFRTPPSSGDVPIFALTEGNGFLVSANGGDSWRRLAPGRFISRLAIDPTDSNRLYFLSGGVVFRSEDGGTTVEEVSADNLAGNNVAIVASRSPIVVAGSGRGIWRSEDSGRVWSAANGAIREVHVQSVVVDPTNPAVLFASNSTGIYESRNGAETWSGPGPRTPGAETLAIDPSNSSTVYAAGPGGVHKSVDSGRTWERKGPSGSVTDYIAKLLIDPNDVRRILAGYGTVYESRDGADSWRSLLQPDDNYSSYYGYPPRVTAMAIAPSNSSITYAGGNDSAFLYLTEDGGANWVDLHSSFGANAIDIDSCDPRIVHVGWWGSIYRTVDGGNNWNPIPIALDLPYPVPITAFARDPRHSSSAFAGTGAGLFWTNDRGASWKRFEPALPESVTSVALDSSGRFLYAGTDHGVFQLERSFEECRDGPDRLCLIDRKFEATLTARHPVTGALVAGHAIIEGDQFGYFSLPGLTADPDFPEVFVKIVNASGLPPPFGGHDWVFHTSLTDFDYTLTIRETATGRVQTYLASGPEPLTCGTADTSAFDRACEVGPSSSPSVSAMSVVASFGTELSLVGGRFRATIRATDPRTGRITQGTAIARKDGFGYFSFPEFTGDPNFPEVFVKMVDGRSQPGNSFWVFHAGLTDVDYTLTVTDTATGSVRTYPRAAIEGTRLCGGVDTLAFHD